jgi:CPA2 family monovalent cation:H+ antiporter-2
MLKLPLLVGYLVAGVAVGPFTPGVVAHAESVHDVAKLGVALLMFAVGVQFHLSDMLAVRRIALGGGSLQIVGTILLGWALGYGLGWGHYGGLFLGCALALSSTAVMMRMMEERGELGTNHGTAILGILVVQDLAVVLMVALLPSLAQVAQEGGAALAGVGWSVLRSAVVVVLSLILARRVVPSLLRRTAFLNSRELFLIVVVCVCIGAAYFAQLAGLSLEIGAFLAGLVISESEYAQEAFAEIRPLRDIFASLFFVSIGMLLDPGFVIRNAPAVAAVVAAIVIGKGILSIGAIYAMRAHGRTAIMAGLGLAQIGEFSFVLASLGSERGLIPVQESGVILSSALISILAAPFVYSAAPRLYDALNRVASISSFLNRRPERKVKGHVDGLQPRVVVLGCGRLGKHVSQALSARGISQIVVDYDAAVVARLRSAGVPVLYGDASSEVVLRSAIPASVELAVVALPEASMAPIAVRMLRQLSPDLPIVARVHHGANIPKVREAGANAVVHAEFEAATAVIRYGLSQLGCPESETEEYIDQIRAVRYREE